MRLDMFYQSWSAAAAAQNYSYNLPGTPAAIYSLRKAVSGYNGYCIRVERSSDSTTMDIGFTANGLVDYASAFTFANGSILTVAIWYDQSGNGQSLTPLHSTPPQFLLINGVPWTAWTNSGNTLGSTCLASASPITLTSDQTIGCVLQLMTDGTGGFAAPMGCYDGTNGWAFLGNYPATGEIEYFNNVGAVTSTTNLLAQSANYVAATRASGIGTLYIGGSNVGSSTGLSNTASTTPFTLGVLESTSNTTLFFEGLIAEAYVYSSALTGVQVAAIQANQALVFPQTGFEIAYNGTASVQFGYNENITMGNVLQYERTQPWTIFAAVQLYSNMGLPSDNAILANINHNTSGFPGYGVLITTDQGVTPNGVLHIILSNTDTGNCLEMYGTTNLVDGKKHLVAVSYAGTSLASGVSAYIDGGLETLTISQNTLSATIIAAGQSLNAGAQINDGINYLRGTLGFVQLDNIVRNQAYIQACTSLTNTPNDAAHTALRLNLTEGIGTTTHDTGALGNAFNGTLTSAGMWRP